MTANSKPNAGSDVFNQDPASMTTQERDSAYAQAMSAAAKFKTDRAQPEELRPGSGPLTRPEKKMKMSDWVYTVSQGVSNAILVILGISILLNTAGNLLHWVPLQMIGILGQHLLAPAIGAGIAIQMRSTTLTTFSAMIAATVGANSIYFTETALKATTTATGWVAPQLAGATITTVGQPVSAVIGGLTAVLVGKWMTGKTPLDMFIVPFCATLVGAIVGLGAATVTTPFLTSVSEALANTMKVNPVLGSAIVSFAWFWFLMTPASSAALAVAVGLDPMSAGAALIGCCAAFAGFTAMSFNQNNPGANIAQGLVTPKIQFPNVIKSPLTALGPMVAAMVMSSLAVTVAGFKVPSALGGLGFSSLTAPLNVLSMSKDSGFSYGWGGLGIMIVFGLVGPAVISWAWYRFLKSVGKTRTNDLHLDVV
ncbi:PTS sugar transporter subunit IIC [Oenococcus sicerae]|uniref:PTS sugar transporter subunit IIC n=1 Tax=Oenococcus sicerae TaxID=2203724 RepID=A0ABX5QK62_9LACO|nr:PTS sugar transporter subunit IIC [Oenococcus sicerae]QAS69158.1 PTS sugar transporter subunit IIC [Oenococcus sicerae]